MTMKTRTITEDVPGTQNRRYFAEVEADDEVYMRREGNTTAIAARSIVATLRCKADAAERRFVESGVLPATEPEPATTLQCQTVRELLARAGAEVTALSRFEHLGTMHVQEALNLLGVIADGRARIA